VLVAGVVPAPSSSPLPPVSVSPPVSLRSELLSELLSEPALEPASELGSDAPDPDPDPDPEESESLVAGEVDVVPRATGPADVTVCAVATGLRSAASAVSCAAVCPVPLVTITTVAATETAASTPSEKRLRRMSSNERITRLE
jgi:hypothetical protein